MPFVRRFRSVPTETVIQEIEGPVIVDLPPPGVVTGAGSGTVLVVGEFEDGPFALDPDTPENSAILQPSGTAGFEQTYGGFGFVRNGLAGSDPCARKHEGEFWNGNGWIKMFGLRFQAFQIARVDTSVGVVSFSPLACVDSGVRKPTPLTVGGVLTVTTDQGGPASSDPIAATGAVVTGAGGTFPTLFGGGEAIEIKSNFQTVTVTFASTDSLLSDVIDTINTAWGSAIASDNGGELELTNTEVLGTGSVITLSDVVGTPLATLGLSAGTTNGTGNVANSSQVTMAEVAAIVNGSAALTAIGVTASVTPDGNLRICSDTTGGGGTVQLDATAMQAELGFGLTEATSEGHPGGTIPAGTRVSASSAPGSSWLTLQTLDVPPGEVGPFNVRVRPTNDDGQALGTGAGTVDVMNAADQVPWAQLTVNNAQALTDALSEPAIDARYDQAMNASLALDSNPSVIANYLLSARRTDAVVTSGQANVVGAEQQGLFGRKFVTGAKLGTSPADALAELGTTVTRTDRMFYTALGMEVTIPQIAARGVAGGVGFTENGVITVRPDGPLTSVCCTLAPEENPAQSLDGLLARFFEVNNFGNVVNIETYKQFKAGGICAPIEDRDTGMQFQSGVTSSTVAGLTTQARRKMADFLQDTFGVFAKPYTGKLNTQIQRDGIVSQWVQFLAGLQSENAPDLQRIEGYAVDDGPNAGNTDITRGKGIFFIRTKVRTLSSLENIVMLFEVGEQVILTVEE